MTTPKHAEWLESVMSGAWDRAQSMQSPTYVIPTTLAEDITGYIGAANQWRSFMFRQESWEQKLTRAIEERSIRSRLRRVGRETRYRLTMATDVLRGTHYCGDD